MSNVYERVRFMLPMMARRKSNAILMVRLKNEEFLAIVGILLIFNVDQNMPFSVAILDRVISYWSMIPIGYVTYIISKKV